MNERWPISVPLLEDELFSSWMTRLALAQGCDPLTLTGSLWPRWRPWTVDPDRGFNNDRLAVLAKRTGSTLEEINKSSLRSIAEKITHFQLDKLATWPWILALGTRNRKRHGGLQYCPKCLQLDSQPYYRKRWRLAWDTGCLDHGLQLIDRCPACNTPIEPHRLIATDHLTLCASCKHDLRQSPIIPCTPEAQAFQQATDEIMATGQSFYGNLELSTIHWFELFRYFILLLRRLAFKQAKKYQQLVSAFNMNLQQISPPATGLALELLPCQERSMLFCGAWSLFKAGPASLVEAVNNKLFTKSLLTDRRQRIPELIYFILSSHDHETRRTRAKKSGEPKYKPRPRQTVMRMFARLERKLLSSA